ncbi:General transcription factor IIH subunit 3 [Aphanomyces cochlioides]|nr:General transcription factor IIH subunit 3 [Aphanomyces cochlioides]
MDGVADGQGGLLVVVLDTNPIYWLNDKEFGLKHAIESVLLFANAYLLQHRNNRLVILAAHAGKSCFLFPDPESDNRTGAAEQFAAVTEQLWRKLIELSQAPIDEAHTKTSLSAGLSLALCFINRAMKETRDLRPRILVVDSSPDFAEQYISIMNCIFSAQKKQIPIDSCVLGTDPSSFLQQASYLTGGIYFKPKERQGLVQYFLSIWLADVDTRSMLKLPSQASVDFRAMCFCHKQTISTAFVCPVCLSLFCEFSPVCSTCGIRSHIKPPKTKRPIEHISS